MAMALKRSDHNMMVIVGFLRNVGMGVFILSSVGRGVPDLLCAYRGKWYMVEIKNGFLGWKRTDAQKKFERDMPAPVVILTSLADAEKWVNSLAT
jgi:hypothetical protein